MRRRLLIIVMVLVTMVLLGLGVPLAISEALAAQQRMFADRLSDTVRFSALAQRPLTEARPEALLAEIRRYDEVYDIGVAIVGRDGSVLTASRPGLAVGDTDRVRVALAARRSEPYPLFAPWDAEPMLLAEPVLVDGEVRGAAVTVSPTGSLRGAILGVWAVLSAAGLLALGAAVLVALPVVRWILRPVQRLDAGLGRVAGAVLAGQPAEPVADDRGPPELRRLTRSFDQMAATVTQALLTQRAFVADASHQLRNPLTALRLRLNNLDRAAGLDSGGEEDKELHAALEEADRLAEVLDGLLALARAERVAPRCEPVALDEVLADRVEAWRVLAEHEGLALRREGPTGLRGLAPLGTMEAVLDALLDNAVKFSPSGGAVVVYAGLVDDQVEVAVLDSGPGLAPDELARATDRFWRSPSAHNLDGSGLGLAIADSMLRTAGGRLVLSLPATGGLRVAARLPAPH